MSLNASLRYLFASADADPSPASLVSALYQTAADAAERQVRTGEPVFLSQTEALVFLEQLADVIAESEAPRGTAPFDEVIVATAKNLCPGLSKRLATEVFHLALAQAEAKKKRRRSTLSACFDASSGTNNSLLHLGQAVRLQAANQPSAAASLLDSALVRDDSSSRVPAPLVASQCVSLLQQMNGCGTNLGNEGKHWDRTRPVPSLLLASAQHSSGSISPTSSASQTKERFKLVAKAILMQRDILAALSAVATSAATETDRGVLDAAFKEARRQQAIIFSWLRDCFCHAVVRSYGFPLALADHWTWRAEFASKMRVHQAMAGAPQQAAAAASPPVAVAVAATKGGGCLPWIRSPKVKVDSPLHALPPSSPAGQYVDAAGSPATVTRSDTRAFAAAGRAAFPYALKPAVSSPTSTSSSAASSVITAAPSLFTSSIAASDSVASPQLIRALNTVVVPLLQAVQSSLLPCNNPSLTAVTEQLFAWLSSVVNSLLVSCVFGLIRGSPFSLAATSDLGSAAALLEGAGKKLLKDASAASDASSVPCPFVASEGCITTHGLAVLASDLAYLRCWSAAGAPVRTSASSAAKGDGGADAGFKGPQESGNPAPGTVPASAAECAAIQSAREKASKHAIASLLDADNSGSQPPAIALNDFSFLFPLASKPHEGEQQVQQMRLWKIADAALAFLWSSLAAKASSPKGSSRSTSKAAVAPAPSPSSSLPVEVFRRAVTAVNGAEERPASDTTAKKQGGTTVIAVKPRQEAASNDITLGGRTATTGTAFATPRKPARPQQVFSTPTAVGLDLATATKASPAAFDGLEEGAGDVAAAVVALPHDALLDWRVDPGEEWI